VEITPDPKLRAFYMELADFEANHTDFLERKIEEAHRGARADSA
jgi:rubrerythrin